MTSPPPAPAGCGSAPPGDGPTRPRRLRIAVWHNLPSGGGKRALHDQVRGLSARGHHVEAWCPDTADRDYLPLGTLIPEHVVPLRTAAGRRGPLGNRLLPWRPLAERLDIMDEHCRACADRIAAGGFDVLLAHPCTWFRTTPIAQHVAIPSLLYLQEPNRKLYEALYEAGPRQPWIDPPVMRSPPPARRLKEAYKALAAVNGMRIEARHEAQWAEAFGGILVNSLFSRESLMRVYGLDADVCYLGIDVDHFRVPSGPKQPYVVSLGSIHPNKRVEVAIEAVGRIDPAIRPALVWVGNFAAGGYADEMRALAERLSVRYEPRVRIDDEELIELLGRAACMIYTPRLEPFGYAPLEANACGTTVVAVAEGGIRETVVDGVNGSLVHRCDPDALARPIERVVADLALASELGRSARQHVERHWGLSGSIDRIEERIMGAVARPTQKPILP